MKNIYLFTMALFIGQTAFSKNSAANSTINPPPVIKQAAAVVSPLAPQPGAALNFDGIDDYVNLGSGMAPMLDTLNTFTVEAWVYSQDSINKTIVGDYWQSTGNQHFLLRTDDLGQYAFFVQEKDSLSTKGVFSEPGSFKLNQWQHVVGVWDGAAIYIYVDGFLTGTTMGVTGKRFGATANPLCIGGSSSVPSTAYCLEGKIDGVRLWSRALCSSEITAYNKCEISDKARGLIANYNFNQGISNSANATVDTLIDVAGGNYTGALINFDLAGTTNWTSQAPMASGMICAAFHDITALAISTQANVLCNGKSTGSAEIKPTGSSPSYTFQWLPSGGTTDSAVALAAKTYTVNVTSACGEMMTIPVVITEAAAIAFTQTKTICAGDSLKVGSKYYKVSGNFTDVISAHNTCDSTITTKLTVLSPVTFTQTPTICFGDSLHVGTKYYKVGGIYHDTLKTKVYACDSAITTKLTVLPAYSSSQSISICAGKSFTIGLHTYTITGNYKDTLTSKTNCDSVVTTNLIVLGAYSSTQSVSICAGKSFTIGIHTYTVTGNYKDTLTSKTNCDSIVTTNLTVATPVNVAVTITSSNIITANASGATYQWIDCAKGNAPIVGATSQAYTAPIGTFAVIVTIGTCSDTSACQQILSIGINNSTANTEVKMYPNPSSGLVNLTIASNQHVMIFNATGQMIYNQELSAGDHLINLQTEPAGMYFVQVVGSTTTQRFKLMKD